MSDDISSQGLTQVRLCRFCWCALCILNERFIRIYNKSFLVQFAQNYAKRGIVPLREIFTPGTLEIPKTPAALKELESIHKVIFFI